jgi:hypothetical protein
MDKCLSLVPFEFSRIFWITLKIPPSQNFPVDLIEHCQVRRELGRSKIKRACP